MMMMCYSSCDTALTSVKKVFANKIVFTQANTLAASSNQKLYFYLSWNTWLLLQSAAIVFHGRLVLSGHKTRWFPRKLNLFMPQKLSYAQSHPRSSDLCDLSVLATLTVVIFCLEIMHFGALMFGCIRIQLALIYAWVSP